MWRQPNSQYKCHPYGNSKVVEVAVDEQLL